MSVVVIVHSVWPTSQWLFLGSTVAGTVTPSVTPTPTDTGTPTATVTPTVTATPTDTATPSPSPTVTVTVTSTAAPSVQPVILDADQFGVYAVGLALLITFAAVRTITGFRR